MHLNGIFTTLLSFAALSVAAHRPFRLRTTNNTILIAPNSAAHIHINLNKRANHCRQSSFEDRGSDVSPLISDCMQMHDNLVRTGEWTYSSVESHRTIASYRSRRFGIESDSAWGRFALIGTGDVRSLIRESVEKFGREDGRVGERGVLKCSGDIEVYWGIF